jgi:hypothetical protein
VRFEVLMVVKIQIKVFWVVIPCNVVVVPVFSEVHSASIFEVKMEAARYPEILVSSTTLHGITTQQTLTCFL